MRYWIEGLVVGVIATAIEVAVVVAINVPAEHPPAQAPKQARRLPIISPDEPVQRHDPLEAPSETPVPTPALAPATLLEPTALPDLPADTHPRADLVSVLPGIDISLAGRGGGSSPAVSAPDRPARAVRRNKPRYPRHARRRGIQGHVVVRLRIDTNGHVTDAVVVASEPAGVFDRAALVSARRYQFEPALIRGKPTPTTVEQRIEFRLSK